MKRKKIDILISKGGFFSVLFLIMLVLISLCASAATDAVAATESTGNFFIDNWEIICLAVSELAALLPSSYSGIIQSLLKILKPLFLAIIKKKAS